MIPAILANEERLRLFKLDCPAWKYLSPTELEARWKEWVEQYNDGWTRIPIKVTSNNDNNLPNET